MFFSQNFLQRIGEMSNSYINQTTKNNILNPRLTLVQHGIIQSKIEVVRAYYKTFVLYKFYDAFKKH